MLVPLLLRPARREDAAAVVEVVNQAYRTEGGWTTEADLVGGPRLEAAGFAALLADPDSLVLVADRDGALVGCVHLRRTGRECLLGMLSVRPSEQGRGLGRDLVAGAEEEALRRWGTEVMAMRVITARPELLAWYERRGYRRTGRLEPFLPQPGVTFLRGPLRFERLEKRLR